MTTRAVVHSVVVPVCDEAEGIEQFHQRCSAAMAGLGEPYEIIYVDDGSRDESWERLVTLSKRDAAVRLVRLSRNFGHQIAISAGIEHATGQTITVIDADLQDPPEVIPELVGPWENGADIVYAVRSRRRGEGRFKRWSAAAFYRIMRYLSDVDIPIDAGDFRLLSRRAADALLQMPERDRYVRGMVAWLGFETAQVSYERDARYAGHTKYPLAKMVRFGLDGIMAFSMRPLRLATLLGFAVSVTAFLAAIALILARLFGDIPVQGWTSLVVLVLLLAGVQLITVGVLGEYIGRVYNEVRKRPLYLTRDVRGFARGDQVAARELHELESSLATRRGHRSL
jgi:glycosyltransferase involved in cell wall biosynthesis